MCLLILRQIAQNGGPMKIETGSLIFAAVNCGLLCIVSFFTLLLPVAYLLNFDIGLKDLQQLLGLTDCQAVVSALFLSAISLMLLGFAFMLNKGLIQKEAIKVKVYFYFGVGVTIVSVCAVIAFSQISDKVVPQDINHLLKVTSLIVLCIYSFILIMLRDTYIKIEREAEESDHEKLFVVSRAVEKVQRGKLYMMEAGLLRPKIERF